MRRALKWPKNAIVFGISYLLVIQKWVQIGIGSIPIANIAICKDTENIIFINFII